MVVKLVGSIICLIGVIMIYYGRDIVKKFFSLNTENLYTYISKVVGFIIAIAGASMMAFL